MGRNANGTGRNDVLIMSKLFFIIFVFSLTFAGCVKDVQDNDRGVNKNNIEQNKPVITSQSYQQSLNAILQPYWDSLQPAGVKNKILELTAPAEFLNLHLNIVIAFELIEQGQKDSDQSKIEDGIDRLNNLANNNDWLK